MTHTISLIKVKLGFVLFRIKTKHFVLENSPRLFCQVIHFNVVNHCFYLLVFTFFLFVYLLSVCLPSVCLFTFCLFVYLLSVCFAALYSLMRFNSSRLTSVFISSSKEKHKLSLYPTSVRTKLYDLPSLSILMAVFLNFWN